MVDAVDALVAALVIAALVLCAVATWAFIELVKSMRSMRALADDTRSRLVPLLDKLDVTIDAVNAELLRVDLIVTRFEDVSDRLSTASDTISELANMPERIAGGIAEKVRSWRTKRASQPDAARPTETGTATEDASSNEGVSWPEDANWAGAASITESVSSSDVADAAEPGTNVAAGSPAETEV